jgi:DNA-binding NarL/FixJ family response regulator
VSIRVVIADDHAPTRAGVRLVLEEAGHEVCAEAATADEAIRVVAAERPDVCLLDIEMPGGGIRAAGEISAQVPETRVVVLTVSRAEGDLFDALRAGAVGFLRKDMDPAALPSAIVAAAQGEGVLDGRLVALLIEEFRRRGSERTSLTLNHSHRVDLTAREWDVLELLADGLPTSEIARRLFVSQVTVRRHVSILMHKLDVRTREDLRSLLARRAG